MEVLADELTYRVYEDNEIGPLLELWEQHSDWGVITKEQFEAWYINTPCGLSYIVVAQNNQGKIIGQLVFTPSILSVNGKEMKVCRGSASILNPEYRKFTLNHADHPAFQLLKFGMQIGKERGFKLVYSFPAQGWIALLKSFSKYGLSDPQFACYDCFALLLDGAHYQENPCLTISTLQQSFSTEYDQLWEDATTLFPVECAVKRNAEWLNWKNAEHLVLEGRNAYTNKLVGYASINKKTGLMVDMLATSKEDLNQLVKAVINYLHLSNPNRPLFQPKKLKGMLTPSLLLVLKDISFQMEPYTFAYGCYILDNSISPENIHPSKWYMMPTD